MAVGRILVQFAMLREARHNMDAAVNTYNDAIEQLRSAAQTLAAGWEGDGQVAFVNSQEAAFGWYVEMGGIVGQIIQTISQIGELLENTEKEVTNIIGGH